MRLDIWHFFGLAAQGVFGSRFLVQWLASEIQGKTVFPLYFWQASLLGAIGLLIYAVHIKDPVFIIGQSFGIVIYSRNLILRQRSARA